MKLYAIRDKETGELVDYIQDATVKDCWVLDKWFGVVWSSDIGLELVAKDLSDTLNADAELVTLRVEPTEPCEWCRSYSGAMEQHSGPDGLMLWADEWKFCPNCGRRLS